MLRSTANLMDEWVLIVCKPDLLFLIWPRYRVSSQLNLKAKGSWVMSHYWVSKITIDLCFLLIPKLLECESQEWLMTSWRGVWGWNVEVTLSKVIQCCPGCSVETSAVRTGVCVWAGGLGREWMVWPAELLGNNDNLPTKTCSSARWGNRLLKWLLTEA